MSGPIVQPMVGAGPCMCCGEVGDAAGARACSRCAWPVAPDGVECARRGSCPLRRVTTGPRRDCHPVSPARGRCRSCRSDLALVDLDGWRRAKGWVATVRAADGFVPGRDAVTRTLRRLAGAQLVSTSGGLPADVLLEQVRPMCPPGVSHPDEFVSWWVAGVCHRAGRSCRCSSRAPMGGSARTGTRTGVGTVARSGSTSGSAAYCIPESRLLVRAGRVAVQR